MERRTAAQNSNVSHFAENKTPDPYMALPCPPPQFPLYHSPTIFLAILPRSYWLFPRHTRQLPSSGSLQVLFSAWNAHALEICIDYSFTSSGLHSDVTWYMRSPSILFKIESHTSHPPLSPYTPRPLCLTFLYRIHSHPTHSVLCSPSPTRRQASCGQGICVFCLLLDLQHLGQWSLKNIC